MHVCLYVFLAFLPLHFTQSTLGLSLISHRSMHNRNCGRKLPLPHALSPRCHAHYAALRCATNNLKLYGPAPPHFFSNSLSLSVGRQRLKIVYYLILFAQFPTNNMLTCWCSHSNNNNCDNNNNKDKNRIGKCCCGNKMKQDSNNNKNNSNTDNDRGL